MPFNIIRNNIVNVEADAIVDTGNPRVAVGRGVDWAIYKAAGWEQLLAEREKIGKMLPGQAAYTPAFGLKAKYIIHTVGPAWQDGDHGEKEAVASCYRRSLGLASELGCGSIAFPLIATGTYRFPKDEALRIAISEISTFLLDHEMDVTLVVFDKYAFELSGKLFDGISEFIDDCDVEEIKSSQKGSYSRISERRHVLNDRRWREDISYSQSLPDVQDMVLYEDTQALGKPQMSSDAEAGKVTGSGAPTADEDAGVPIEDMLKKMDRTFQEHLFDLIDKKQMNDPDVYKKANIDRKLFSKIRSNPAYKPSKRTAVALAIALELNLDETADLLKRAGYALSESNVFDLIIRYCIINRHYNIVEINCILFDYDQQLLGA